MSEAEPGAAVVTTRAIEVASGHGNYKALALLSRAKHA